MTDSIPPPVDPQTPEAARALLLFGLAHLRQWELFCAKAMVHVERTLAYRLDGSGSIANFAERNGAAAQVGRDLLDVGHALIKEPDLAVEIASGAIPVASAAVYGQIVFADEGLRGSTDWRALARTCSTREFRRAWFQHRDEARAGEPLHALNALVTAKTREGLDRARTLASRKSDCVLTMGETVGVVVRDWLRENDPLQTKPGTRRVPDTADVPGRYIPAEVDRQVRARSNDTCIVPMCGNKVWLERSHRIAHAHGGSREARNIDRLCCAHHLLYALKKLLITGSTENPTITDDQGRPMSGRITIGPDDLKDVETWLGRMTRRPDDGVGPDDVLPQEPPPPTPGSP
jgi:hypothetical protein